MRVLRWNHFHIVCAVHAIEVSKPLLVRVRHRQRHAIRKRQPFRRIFHFRRRFDGRRGLGIAELSLRPVWRGRRLRGRRRCVAEFRLRPVYCSVACGRHSPFPTEVIVVPSGICADVPAGLSGPVINPPSLAASEPEVLMSVSIKLLRFLSFSFVVASDSPQYWPPVRLCISVSNAALGRAPDRSICMSLNWRLEIC